MMATKNFEVKIQADNLKGNKAKKNDCICSLHFFCTIGDIEFISFQQRDLRPLLLSTIGRFFKTFLDESQSQLQIGVWVVGSTRIRTLNRKFRKKDKVTDVLSFPIHEQEFLNRLFKSNVSKKGALTADSGNARTVGIVEEVTILGDNCINLGDIVICHAKAKQAAKIHGISYLEEFTNLLVHGLLHLLGYDHELSPAKEKEMFKLQNNLVRKILMGHEWKIQ